MRNENSSFRGSAKKASWQEPWPFHKNWEATLDVLEKSEDVIAVYMIQEVHIHPPM